MFSKGSLLANTTLTSQIVLMNSEGASLASDSAVTFGDDRTFNTVNKIFPLGGEDSGHKIAFMISGGARHAPTGLLWERIFGLFYEECVKPEQTDFDTVESYAEGFIDFLNEEHNLPYDAPSNSLNIQESLMKWFLQFPPVQEKMKEKEVTTEFEKVIPLDYERLDIKLPASKNLNEFLDYFEGVLQKADKELGSDNEWKQRILRIEDKHDNSSKFVASLLTDQFNLSPKRARRELLRRMFNFHLAMTYNTTHTWSTSSTTIAIVGFGSKEIVPTMFQLNSGIISDPEYGCASISANFVIRNRTTLEDMADHRLRCLECGASLNQHLEPDEMPVCDDPHCAGHGRQKLALHSAPAFLVPFAMSSEIQNTLNGLHDDLRFIYSPRRKDIHRGRMNFPKTISEILTKGIIEELKDVSGIGPSLLGKVEEKFNQSLRDNIEGSIREVLHDHVHTRGEVVRRQKFRRVVMGLPIADLSAFARTLVNLQASINYYLEPVQSVGGDIDLVSITKEDGFQWVD